MAARQQFTWVEYMRSALSVLLFFILLSVITPIILLLLTFSFGKMTNFVVEKIAPAVALPVLKIAGVDFKIKKHMLAPEGSRKHPGVIGLFKKGPFRMAMDLQYPVVPIYFEGNRELSTEDFLITKTGSCTAHIHSAIDTSDWKLENIDNICDVRNRYLEWAGVENDNFS